MIPNVSREVLDAWSACLDSLPAIDDLRSVINAPLLRPLPYPSWWAGAELHPPDADVATASPGLLAPAVEAICTTLFSRQRNGSSEDSLHAVYDSLITDVLVLLRNHVSLGLRLDRNTIDKSGTTKGQTRPDFLCWLPSGILGFKGEEKASAEELHVAREELSSKLAAWTPTFFGEIPYQVGYAAGGETIQFFAMDVRNGGRIVSMCDAFTVTTPKARSQCVRMAVNLFRLLRTLQLRFPEHCLSLGDVITRPESCVVTIHGDFVSKRAAAFTGPELEELYLALLARPIECLARPKKAPKVGASLTVQIQPVGFFRNPGEQIKDAVRSVLTALCGLHEIRWVHRDVRTTNIMEVPGKGWYLMDLEWAQRVGLPLENYAPKRDNSPPEIREGGDAAVWTAAADMWQFGKVLDFWGDNGSSLGEMGKDLCLKLMAERPEDRPTAQQALKHMWLIVLEPIV